MAVDNIARGMAAKALENQGGGGGSLPIVNTATVGQTIRVSAVDENGKPTEWEAVDMTSGGGFRKIIDYTTEERTFTPDIQSIDFSEDLEGNAICAENLYFKVSGTITGGKEFRIALNRTNFLDIYFGTADEANVSQGFISFSAGVANFMAPYGSTTVVCRKNETSGEKITSIRFFSPNYNAIHLERGARIEVWEVGNA